MPGNNAMGACIVTVRYELADKATKEATQLNSGTPKTSPINIEVAKSIIKRTKCDHPPAHPLIEQCRHTANKSRSEIKQRKNRKDGVTMGKLRSGNCNLLCLLSYCQTNDETKSEDYQLWNLNWRAPNTLEHQWRGEISLERRVWNLQQRTPPGSFC